MDMQTRPQNMQTRPQNMQTRPQGGFTSNLWAQFAALVIVVAVLIALAAQYVW
jgi:hypothetical protein